MHVTSVLILVWFNNFALTMVPLLELHTHTLVARSYVLLLHYRNSTVHFKCITSSHVSISNCGDFNITFFLLLTFSYA